MELLQYEIKKLNNFNNQLKLKLTINPENEEVRRIFYELSGMLLSSNSKPNLTENQKSIIRSLFGDVATQAYKEKIKTIQESLEYKTREIVVLKEDLRQIMTSYLDDINKFSKTINLSINLLNFY